MSVDLVVFIGTMVLSALGAAYGYGKLNARNERNNEKIDAAEQRQKKENENLWKVMTDVRKAAEDHIKDSNEKRFAFQTDVSHLREAMGNRDGKLDAIMGQLDEIKKKIDRLEARP